MDVFPIPAFTDNYIWAITQQDSRMFDCVDPGEARPVLDFCQKNNLSLRTILLTHHHNDHIGGVKELLDTFPQCIVYGPHDARIPYVTHRVKEDQLIQVGTQAYTILFNPGHTASHISYYEANEGWLFCGDTLFSAGCGRVFDGTMEQLHDSMLLFKSLPANTKVFCAHEYTAQNLKFAHAVEPHNQAIDQYLNTIKSNASPCSLPSTLTIELSINPFLRTDIATVQQYALEHGAKSTNSCDVFTVLRNQKNGFR